MSLRPGRHVACCVALEPGWISYATEKTPFFRRSLEAAPASSPTFLPYVRMDSFLHRRLEEVLALKRNGHGRLDGFLRYKFAEILEYYDPRAAEKQRSLTYRVKDYLDASFRTHGLNSGAVAEHFGIKERTLRNRFKAEFNLTVRDYYTACRLRYATMLMKSKKLPVRDVYYPAGYNDESTFRYELRKNGLSNRQNT
ncbi:MAG: AraC family transcriptional regulator [Leadbetterella sp.]|nr:AraC family transcriptional regulator [Leadbetterella sp.]